MKYYCKKTKKAKNLFGDSIIMKAGEYYEVEYVKYFDGRLYKCPWQIHGDCDDGIKRWCELTEFQFSKTFNTGSRKEKLNKLNLVNNE